MKEYLRIVREVLSENYITTNRTGTDTYSKFSVDAKYDIRDFKIPLLTTKKIHYPAIIHELIWMLSGSDNIKYLKDNNVRIWDEWADENGDLNKVYGKQWRQWNDTRIVQINTKHDQFCAEKLNYIDALNDDYRLYTRDIDQIKILEDTLRKDPTSRRMILTAWNVSNIEEMALPPCHTMSQFYTRLVNGQRYLDCKLYQRSGDIFLGVPFNIAFYSLLVHMLCHAHNMKPGYFYHSIGDAHIYVNHIDQVNEQLSRDIIDCEPKVLFKRDVDSILDITYNDIEIIGYKSHPTIKGIVAV